MDDLKKMFEHSDDAPPAIPAATLVIFRNAPDGGAPQLLMVQRSKEMRFAGGAAVFPGGRVDEADRVLAAAHGPADDDEHDELAARIAAVRETLEETGLAVGFHQQPDLASARRARELLLDKGELGAVLASDECYAELGWDGWSDKLIPSVLDPRVCGGDHSNLLALYSLSKQSNMAGHRAAFAAGDAALVKALINLRMHAGLNTPAPVQHAIAVALGDYEHVKVARDTYGKRRDVLLPAIRDYGFELSDSQAGLYLWATLHEDCWKTVDRMAELGIVVVPGTFYGEHSTQHVRFSLTATDAKIAEAARRLRDAIGLRSL